MKPTPTFAKCSPAVLVAAFLAAAPLAARAAEPLAALTDPTHPAVDASLDIIAASITQDGGRLTFAMELRGPLPAALPAPDDIQAYLWYVDADGDPATGQPHGDVGSEFNVRAVIGQAWGGGWVDVTGAWPGGGEGEVAVDGANIRLTVWLGQVGNPATFNWRCATFAEFGGAWLPGNDDTDVAGATPEPFPRPARAMVVNPILQLCPSGPATGQLVVELRDGDGNLVPNEGHYIAFNSTNPGVATVDANGLVTAITPPAEHWQTPYIEVQVDGEWADNAAVVRVNPFDPGVVHERLQGARVNFYLPPLVEGVDLAAVTAGYEVVAATDLAWAAQEQALGRSDNHAAGTDWLVLDLAAEPQTSVCGASGNPIRLGWTLGMGEHNSCYIINDPARRRPQWFVLWHELGHNFTTTCNAFNMFLWTPSGDHNTTYGEGLASLAAMYAWKSLMAAPGQVSAFALADIDGNFRDNCGAWSEALAQYRAGGRDYATINPDVLDGILLELWDAYGSKCWYDLFSTFQPTEAPLPVAIDTVEKQATWLVAAMCASTGQDLRSWFAAEYGLPVDAAAWDEIRAVVEARIAARDFNAAGAGDLPTAAAHDHLWNVAPNPFNPRTSVGVTLAQAARVQLVVYDLQGRRVRRLVDEPLAGGPHPQLATWDGLDDRGRTLPSGGYLLRLSVDGRSVGARKVTLLR